MKAKHWGLLGTACFGIGIAYAFLTNDNENFRKGYEDINGAKTIQVMNQIPSYYELKLAFHSEEGASIIPYGLETYLQTVQKDNKDLRLPADTPIDFSLRDIDGNGSVYYAGIEWASQ